ncbi:MAG: sulfur carrier protein ThiS [Proteobacteria bacterium]|nr:sulfur carrier protein ThiS [Pseudomonadota bacterium]
MKIRVNGEDRVFDDGLKIEALLDLLGVERKGIAVELNKEVVPKSRHSEVALSEGDLVEIITMFGGG